MMKMPGKFEARSGHHYQGKKHHLPVDWNGTRNITGLNDQNGIRNITGLTDQNGIRNITGPTGQIGTKINK